MVVAIALYLLGSITLHPYLYRNLGGFGSRQLFPICNLLYKDKFIEVPPIVCERIK